MCTVSPVRFTAWGPDSLNIPASPTLSRPIKNNQGKAEKSNVFNVAGLGRESKKLDAPPALAAASASQFIFRGLQHEHFVVLINYCTCRARMLWHTCAEFKNNLQELLVLGSTLLGRGLLWFNPPWGGVCSDPTLMGRGLLVSVHSVQARLPIITLLLCVPSLAHSCIWLFKALGLVCLYWGSHIDSLKFRFEWRPEVCPAQASTQGVILPVFVPRLEFLLQNSLASCQNREQSLCVQQVAFSLALSRHWTPEGIPVP